MRLFHLQMHFEYFQGALPLSQGACSNRGAIFAIFILIETTNHHFKLILHSILWTAIPIITYYGASSLKDMIQTADADSNQFESPNSSLGNRIFRKLQRLWE